MTENITNSSLASRSYLDSIMGYWPLLNSNSSNSSYFSSFSNPLAGATERVGNLWGNATKYVCDTTVGFRDGFAIKAETYLPPVVNDVLVAGGRFIVDNTYTGLAITGSIAAVNSTVNLARNHVQRKEPPFLRLVQDKQDTHLQIIQGKPNAQAKQVINTRNEVAKVILGLATVALCLYNNKEDQIASLLLQRAALGAGLVTAMWKATTATKPTFKVYDLKVKEATPPLHKAVVLQQPKTAE